MYNIIPSSAVIAEACVAVIGVSFKGACVVAVISSFAFADGVTVPIPTLLVAPFIAN